jgi:hypothetical protein
LSESHGYLYRVLYSLVIGGVEVANAAYVVRPGETPPAPATIFKDLLDTPVTISIVTISYYKSKKKGKSLTFEVHVNTGGTVLELGRRIGLETFTDVEPAPPDEQLGLQGVNVKFGALTEAIRSWAVGEARGSDVGSRIIDSAMEAIMDEYPVVGIAYLESNLREVVADVSIGQQPPAEWPFLSLAEWRFRHEKQ